MINCTVARQPSGVIISILLTAGLSAAFSAIARGSSEFFHLSDQDIAKCPVIVVGRWARAPQSKGSNGWVETVLFVEYSLKGGLKPGKHRIRLNRPIGPPGWTDPDPIVPSSQPYEESGFLKSQLWFLDRIAGKDKEVIFALTTTQKLRPKELEPYFRVLISPARDTRIGQLLGSRSIPVVRRALRYINGDVDLWPAAGWHTQFGPRFRYGQGRLVQHSAAVRKLLHSKEVTIRQYAAAAYASLEGRKARPILRHLKNDTDLGVRKTIATFVEYLDKKAKGKKLTLPANVGIPLTAELG